MYATTRSSPAASKCVSASRLKETWAVSHDQIRFAVVKKKLFQQVLNPLAILLRLPISDVARRCKKLSTSSIYNLVAGAGTLIV